MTDPIPARRYDFAIAEDNGTPKPVTIILPASLTWEELSAVIGGVNEIGQQVAKAAAQPKTALTLVHGALPKEPA